MRYKILIYYHTASGNTGWITAQLLRKLNEQDVDAAARNVAHQRDTSDLDKYDMVGFGCPVMGFRPTFAMSDFIHALPRQSGKPVFMFVSYAGVCASAPWMLAGMLNKKGFTAVAAEQFRSEVSWPVARVTGIIPSRGRPDERELPSIVQFAKRIYGTLKDCTKQNPVTHHQVPFARLDPFSYMALLNKAPYLRFIMGTKRVNEARCTRCGLCRKHCAAGAIVLNPYPHFSDTCIGCWGCYNICPEGAIASFTGTRGRYTARTAFLDAPVLDNP